MVLVNVNGKGGKLKMVDLRKTEERESEFTGEFEVCGVKVSS